MPDARPRCSEPDAARPVARPVPILMYHHVGPVAPPRFEKYSVRPRQLARQLAWLKRLGYRGVTLDEMLDGWEHGAVSRAVAITFDDGFRDSFEHAAPVLQRFGFTATFFLVSGEMGRVGTWLARRHGVSLAIMGWSDAWSLARAGFGIGAHSISHPKLGEVDGETLRRELVGARVQIEERVGQPVAHVAYPYGSCTPAVADAARSAGYRSGCTTAIGVARAGHSRWALPRIPVDGRAGTGTFIARLLTGHTVPELASPHRWWRRLSRPRAPAAAPRHPSGRLGDRTG